MKLLKALIYGNAYIAFAAAVITFSWAQRFNIGSWQIFVCVFFATLCIYNLQRLLRINQIMEGKSERHTWIIKNKSILIWWTIIAGVFAATLYFFYFFSISSLLLLSIAGLVGILYAFRWKASIPTFREIPYLKIYLIAFTWTIVNLIWPITLSDYSISDNFDLVIIHFLIILAITIPFDIRDLPYDQESQRTIPQLLGVKKAQHLSFFLLFVGVNYLFFFFPWSLFDFRLFGFLLLAAYLIYAATPKKSELFYSLGVDGLLIGYAILIYGV